jgi:hypothetical protein
MAFKTGSLVETGVGTFDLEFDAGAGLSPAADAPGRKTS